MEGSSSGPQFDDFVGRVVTDPANPPNAVLLQGFVGASDAEDHVRVYTDPSLASYVDVPAASILHSERLPAEQSPLGGSLLWVDRSAQLRPPATAAPQAAAADFLRGPIQAALGPAAAPEAGAIRPTLFTQLGCGSLGIACTVVECPRPTTAATLCTQVQCPPTSDFTCPRTSTCPPTSVPGCATPADVVTSIYSGCFAGGPGQAITATCPQGRGFAAPDTTMLGCPSTSTCAPPQRPIGPTGWLGCSYTSCPPTHALGCPGSWTCPPDPSASQLCATNIACPSHAIPCNTWICGPGGGA